MSLTNNRLVLRDDPFVDWGANTLEFRLTYEGPLMSGRGESRRAGVADCKQWIRKQFHPQLRRLWEISPFLQSALAPQPQQPGVKTRVFGRPKHSIESLAQEYNRLGYRFVPLVTEDLELLCSIDILFLRPHPPGSLIQSGDIDNRLKTLIDGLQMPEATSQLGQYVEPDAGEDPFFVLLTNDKLITRIAVETDTLLEPLSQSSGDNDARVVITVKLQPYHLRSDNIGFG